MTWRTVCLTVWMLIGTGYAAADVLTVDPDAGTLSVDGGAYAATVNWQGVQISNGGVGGEPENIKKN